MNQFCKKASFISGLILLFSPIIFSNIFEFITRFRNFWAAFDTEQIVTYIVFFIAIILEIIFFLKILKAYRLREPGTYYLVYFIGIITMLGLVPYFVRALYISMYAPHLFLFFLLNLKIPFLFILLFALFSFRHQKERFLLNSGSVNIRRNIIIFLIIAMLFGAVSYYSYKYIYHLFNGLLVPPYLLPLILSFALIPWWRRVISGTLRNFFFLPGLFVIIAHLILELSAFLYIFQV